MSEISQAVAAEKPSFADAIRPYLQKGPLTALFLGISSGFPFTLIAATLTQRLSEGGIERKTISAFALVLLVYSVKWAWAPIVDRVKLPLLSVMGQRLSWLWLTGAAVAFGVWLLGNADPAAGVQQVLLAALVLAFAGATFDIVIDAMRIEHLQPEQLGVGSGMSQYGWRLGAFFAGSIALAVAKGWGWNWGYWACAPLVLSALLISLWAGEPAERQKRTWPVRMQRNDYIKFIVAIPVVLLLASVIDGLLGANILFRISLFGFIYPLVDLSVRRAHDLGWSGHTAWLLALPVVASLIGNWPLFLVASFVALTYVGSLCILTGNAGVNAWGEAPATLEKRNVVGPMVDFFRRKGAWLVFLFVLVHKIGDTMANLMIRDLLVTVGFDKDQILWGDVVVGFWALLAGIFVGGILYARLGMKRAVLISLILMGVSNFSFAGLSLAGKSVAMLAFTIGFENFASGVGGVAVVALLSAICNLRFTATQFAMLSAAAAILGRFLTGTLAGRLIDGLGYVDFYLLTTALALPGILLFWYMMRAGLIDEAIGSAGGKAT
jgi:MFS transporter, PAT family, beta-lactamase induction signal transducer AmpG